MHTYRKSDHSLWTVGFHSPVEGWYALEDYGTEHEARQLVSYLNGGLSPQTQNSLIGVLGGNRSVLVRGL